MSDDNTQASIAELKEAVSNLKEFTKRAETTLEALRKENKDGRHELRNEFQAKFSSIENTIDVLRKEQSDIQIKLKDRTCADHGNLLTELKSKTNFLEKVTFMGLGGLAFFEIILRLIK